MSRPLFRLTAAACLTALALVSGSARACYVAPDMPKWEYPDLGIKPTDLGEETQEPTLTDEDIVTMIDSAPPDLAYQTTGTGLNTMPVKTGDVWTWMYNGVQYTCNCATPTGGTPTPSENAPEPSSLALLAAGSAALLLARRRRRG